LIGTTTIPVVTVIVTTNSDNAVIYITSTSQMVQSSITGYSEYTTAPGLTGNGSSNSGGGISGSSKKIIAGVVGGIGGAILLGAIIFACWRIWGNRNRYNPDDDLDYAAGTGQGLGSSPGKDEGIANDNDHESRYTGSTVRPNAAANF
jgi:hypothetical protein